MRIHPSVYTIAELIDKIQRREVIVNKEYQRSSKVWPSTARTYFIDTILENYPFPKIYLFQSYNLKTRSPIMEIIDGQQRLTAIADFVSGELRLSNGSRNYSGYVYDDLPEEKKNEFMMYSVFADVILSANTNQILEMFRRMNAYTAPLNYSEKRHAKYEGRFKWFAIELANEISPIFEEFGILTPKQIVRMDDTEFIAELVIVLEHGLVSKSERMINDLYSKYDKEFPNETFYRKAITDFFDLLVDRFGELKKTLIMKSYAVHSLFAAYANINIGIPDGVEGLDLSGARMQMIIDKKTINALIAVSEAHELKEEDGPYGDYVRAALSTTTKAKQRIARTRVLAEILLGNVKDI